MRLSHDSSNTILVWSCVQLKCFSITICSYTRLWQKMKTSCNQRFLCAVVGEQQLKWDSITVLVWTDRMWQTFMMLLVFLASAPPCTVQLCCLATCQFGGISLFCNLSTLTPALITIYLCIYIYIYIITYVYTHQHVSRCIWPSSCVCLHICINKCMFPNVFQSHQTMS